MNILCSCSTGHPDLQYHQDPGSDRADRGTERVGERAGEKGKRGEVTGSDPGYYQLHDGEECRGVVEKDKRTG